eukprot:4478881-Prymnesium_polylepis.2
MAARARRFAATGVRGSRRFGYGRLRFTSVARRRGRELVPHENLTAATGVGDILSWQVARGRPAPPKTPSQPHSAGPGRRTKVLYCSDGARRVDCRFRVC